MRPLKVSGAASVPALAGQGAGQPDHGGGAEGLCALFHPSARAGPAWGPVLPPAGPGVCGCLPGPLRAPLHLPGAHLRPQPGAAAGQAHPPARGAGRAPGRGRSARHRPAQHLRQARGHAAHGLLHDLGAAPRAQDHDPVPAVGL
uniref:Putative secreted protein n=1 Tax=Ixodes ricinus TaxID=34613 RepID=A0A6B0UUH8_IXORI